MLSSEDVKDDFNGKSFGVVILILILQFEENNLHKRQSIIWEAITGLTEKSLNLMLSFSESLGINLALRKHFCNLVKELCSIKFSNSSNVSFFSSMIQLSYETSKSLKISSSSKDSSGKKSIISKILILF